MGCDIHCYIEYRREGDWGSFGGKINPGRAYRIFAAMAGVRNYWEVAVPVVEPRGIPDDLGRKAFSDYTIYVDGQQEEPFKHEDGEIYYSLAHAEDHVSKGYCAWVEQGRRPKTFVSNSDWHTPSWLTPDEFEIAISTSPGWIEYHAILATLRFFEGWGYEARLVFWFDN